MSTEAMRVLPADAPAEDHGDRHVPERAELAGSPLEALRHKVRAARDARVLELDVPDIPSLVVRFRPIEAEELGLIYKTRRKAPMELQQILSSCDVLAKTCVGLFERGADGVLHAEGDILRPEDGEAFTFATLAQAAAAGTVVDVIKPPDGVYVTDGDVVSTSEKIVRFSGFTNPVLQEAILGE